METTLRGEITFEQAQKGSAPSRKWIFSVLRNPGTACGFAGVVYRSGIAENAVDVRVRYDIWTRPVAFQQLQEVVLRTKIVRFCVPDLAPIFVEGVAERIAKYCSVAFQKFLQR
jgi:hypothetical protein